MTSGGHADLREGAFEEQQTALLNKVSAGGMSVQESTQKALADKAAAEAAKAAKEKEEEDSAEHTSKRLKTGEDEEENDEETELLYAQAMQDQDADNNVLLGGNMRRGSGCKRANAGAGVSPNKKVARVDGGLRPSRPSTPRHGPQVVGASGSATVRDSQLQPHPADAATAAVVEAEVCAHQTWSKSKNMMKLRANVLSFGALFMVPDALTKNAQKTKWNTEVTKSQAWLQPIDRALSSTGKVTDQNLKSALTAAKKINSKVDKRVEFETGHASEAQKTFFARVLKMRSVLEALIVFRPMVLNCAKQGIEYKPLCTNIQKIQAAFHDL